MYKVKLFAATLSLCLVIAPSAKAKITVLTWEQPPLVEEGASSGIAIDTAKALFERSGVEAEFKSQSIKRATKMAKERKNNCALPLQRTQARERDYEWVSPVYVNRYALYSMSDESDISVLADASGKKMGVTYGSASADYLENVGFDLETTTFPEVKLGIKMLDRGRIDLLAGNTLTVSHFANASDVKLNKGIEFRTTLLALACNKNVDDSTLTSLRKTLREMYNDGTIKGIIEDNTSEYDMEMQHWYR